MNIIAAMVALFVKNISLKIFHFLPIVLQHFFHFCTEKKVLKIVICMK